MINRITLKDEIKIKNKNLFCECEGEKLYKDQKACKGLLANTREARLQSVSGRTIHYGPCHAIKQIQ